MPELRFTHLEKVGSFWWALVEWGDQGYWGRDKDPYKARAMAYKGHREYIAKCQRELYDSIQWGPAE